MPNDITHEIDPETPDLEFLVNHCDDEAEELYLLILAPRPFDGGNEYETVHCGRITVVDAYEMSRNPDVDYFQVSYVEDRSLDATPLYEVTFVLKAPVTGTPTVRNHS